VSSSPMHPEEHPAGPHRRRRRPPGSLQITERRSWPTSVLVVAALIAGWRARLSATCRTAAPPTRARTRLVPDGAKHQRTKPHHDDDRERSRSPLLETHPTRGNAARTVARAPL